MRRLVSILVSMALPSLHGTLSAQTFVVDAAGGPGTNFTSIAAAVAAVPDGARLLVRPGTYAAFTVHQKGLTILGDAGAAVLGTARFENSLANQTTVFAGFTLLQPPNALYGLSIADCLGLVAITDITGPPVVQPLPPTFGGFSSFPASLAVLNCSQLVLRDSSLFYVVLNQSTVLIDSCIRGGCPGTTIMGWPVAATQALPTHHADVRIVGATQLHGGGSGASGLTPGEALRTFQGTVRMLDGLLASGPAVPYAVPAAVIFQATLLLDPRVVVQSTATPPIYGGATVTPMPMVVSTNAPPGGTMVATVATAAGDAVALCAAQPAAPWSLPGSTDALWLDPVTASVRALAVQQSAAPVTASIVLPTSTSLAGAAIAWQAFAWNASSAFVLTNPSLAIVR